MLEQLGYEFDYFIESAKLNLPIALYILAFLWGVNLINWLTRNSLNIFGIVPRNIFSLPGIIIAPILHGNFNHLFFNSIPLFCLTLFVMTDGLETFVLLSIIIVLSSGLATWLIGRRGVHIGASGVIAGYFAYVLIAAYESPTFTSVFLGVLALYYFGGILLSLLPSEDKVSFEGHIAGFLSGILAYYLTSYI